MRDYPAEFFESKEGKRAVVAHSVGTVLLATGLFGPLAGLATLIGGASIFFGTKAVCDAAIRREDEALRRAAEHKPRRRRRKAVGVPVRRARRLRKVAVDVLDVPGDGRVEVLDLARRNAAWRRLDRWLAKGG